MTRRRKKVELSLNPCKLKGDRGNRTPRSAMFGTLFVMIWSAILCGVKFLAILGLTIGVGTAFIGTLGGVGLFVLVSWFLVNFITDGTMWGSREYRKWRGQGGDPYFDWTWFAPLNMDSDEVRATGGYVTCPHPNCCQEFSPKRSNTCPYCGFDQMDFLRCGSCGSSVYDPDRVYDTQTGVICTSCGCWTRSPNFGNLPAGPGLPSPDTHEIVHCSDCHYAFFVPMGEFTAHGADCPLCRNHLEPSR